MRVPTIVRVLILASFVATGTAGVAHAQEFLLGGGKLQMSEGTTPSKRKVTFQGRWTQTGSTGMANPTVDGPTLRVFGGPNEGDSGLIRLANGNWRPLKNGKGFQYNDATQSAGGIKTVVVKAAKKGGTVKVVGGKEKWAYSLAKPQT